MKDYKVILIIALLLAITLVILIFNSNKKEHLIINPYPPASNYSFYSIHEIKQNNLSRGYYNTEGYVSKVYGCAPCPVGAQCGMCMAPNIVISEENRTLEIYELSDKDLIIFTASFLESYNVNKNLFKIGEKYRFSVNFTDYKSTNEKINDVYLIGFDKGVSII
jgi:hypothetical protein